jgi:hypothetical protein
MKNKIVIIIMIIIIIKVLRVPTPYMAQGRLDSISPLGPIVCAGDMHGHAHAGTAVASAMQQADSFPSGPTTMWCPWPSRDNRGVDEASDSAVGHMRHSTEQNSY